MVLKKLSNKVTPKKYRESDPPGNWKNTNHQAKVGSMVVEWHRGKGRGREREEKWRAGENLGNGMVEMKEGQIWEQGRTYLNEGKHFGVGKKIGARGDPRSPHGCPS